MTKAISVPNTFIVDRLRDLRERMRASDAVLVETSAIIGDLRAQAYKEKGKSSDTDLWLLKVPEFAKAISDNKYHMTLSTSLAAQITAETQAYEFMRARALEAAHAKEHPPRIPAARSR